MKTLKFPQVGSIYKIKGQLCYVYHCDGIFRITAISKNERLSNGWFENGSQKEIPLTQKWLDILKKFDTSYKEEVNGYYYDLNSNYLKDCNHQTLNEYLFQAYSMKNIYDFEVKQTQTNSNIYINAKLKKEVFEEICKQFGI